MMYLILLLALWAPPAAAQQGIGPCHADTISATNGSSTNIQLSSCGQTVLVWNIGTEEAFYKSGTASTTAATTSDFSLPGNSFVVLNLGLGSRYLAAITNANSTTLRITQGQTR